MKIIDLLVKISKGEEVPKEINYQGSSYYFDGRDYVLYRDEEINYLSDDSLTRYINSFMLNDEVEIIEEEKEIEKIKGIDTRETRDCIIKFQEKFNEIIDVINDMRDRDENND